LFKYVSGFLPRGQDYDLRYLKNDLLAGLTVAVVALPLALGFGVTSGAGAAAGLYTAIVAGVVAAIFGGSSFQVTGPTGAMTAILLPLVADYGAHALPAVGLMAGVFLLILAFARVGHYVQYIPWPVVTGFTNGIAIIIFLQQVPNLLGMEMGSGHSVLLITWNTLRAFAAGPVLAPLAIGLLTVFIMLLWSRFSRLQVLPASMAALLAGTFLSLLPWFSGVPRIGEIPRSLPLPQMPFFAFDGLTDLVRAALAVAALAALESLLSAVVADGMTVRERHDPDRELLGQGLGNLAAAFFGGIPSTGVLARTAVNVRSGARTRLAGMVHGLALLLVVLFLAPVASLIPLAVLAGILIVVAVRMVEREAMRLILRSTKSDAFVMILTTVITVVFDLILAIEVGLIAAAVLFIVRMSSMFTVDPEALAVSDVMNATGEERPDWERLKKKIVVYRVAGPIFFGAANRFFDTLLKLDKRVRIVILRLGSVPVMDATGVTALYSLVGRLEKQGVTVFISGLQPQPRELLKRMGVLGVISARGDHLFVDTESAISYAAGLLQASAEQDDERTSYGLSD
jgi:SulP family sulfate permease